MGKECEGVKQSEVGRIAVIVQSSVKSYSWSKNQITVRVSRVSASARFRLIISVVQCRVKFGFTSLLIWF